MIKNKLIKPNCLANIMLVSPIIVANFINKKHSLRVDMTPKRYLTICSAKKIAHYLQYKSPRPLQDVFYDLDNYKPY